MENSMKFPQNTKNKIAIRSSNTTHKDILKECKSYNKGACIPVFIPALFTIAKSWKQPR
jgi:hypothetical protein